MKPDNRVSESSANISGLGLVNPMHGPDDETEARATLSFRQF